MDEQDDLEDAWKTNRQKRLEPRMGLFYCQCDRDAVGVWRKCEFCGARNGVRRNKK